MPKMLGLDRTLSASGSISRLKMRGDRGHPCLVPLEIEKGSDNLEEQYT